MPRLVAASTAVVISTLLFAHGVSEAQDVGSRAANDAAVRDVVRQYAEARAAMNPAATASLFTADADQLVSSGQWRRGREALVKGTMASSAGNPGKRTLEVETIRYLGQDVALADARYEIAGNGTVRRLWSTFVLVREGTAWRITAIRNMLPATP
jgi:uncharacterized protein (TIGR02246 family)